MNIYEILQRCDHSLLRQEATSAEIMKLCDEGIKYNTATVCIPPCHVKGAKAYAGDRVRICTVVGFPNGYGTTRAKAFEASEAVSNGADEIDMVINLAMVKDCCYDDLLGEIREVRAFTGGKTLKVIIETCLLTQEEKKILCGIVSASGADFIKTSTGFSTGGASREDVLLLREHCAGHVKIKASGGVRSLEDAAMLIEAGADRIGASGLVKAALEMGDRVTGEASESHA